MASITGLTIEDFESLPAALAKNHELVDGELVDVSGNTLGHNCLRGELYSCLNAYVDKRGLGMVISEQDFDFDGNAHGPDVSNIGSSKMALIERDRRVQSFVPDLAIEIVRPDDGFEALVAKVLRYVRYGTREVFVFSLLNRQVYRYTETGGQILAETDDFRPETIPGFSIRIADLFALV